MMRAILLAAGFGTRLRPITDTIPKCLVPIKGSPLLGIWLERLTRAGIGPFLINTHYLHEQVEAFAESSPHRNVIKLVHEAELKGTAGTIIENLNFYENQDGLLIHADNYCLADFEAFMLAHEQRPPECLMTMMTFRTEAPSSCGIVELDARDVVIDFHEKVSNPPGNLANGAVYILSNELIQRFGTDFGTLTDFSTEVLGALTGKIYSYETDQVFVDIGTPENLIRANEI